MRVFLLTLFPQVFHCMSFAILVFFMLEIFFKIFVFRMEFFHHKFEILDAIVVVLSFVLDLVLFFKKHQFEALGLLILLRLWRVARIINGASPVLQGYTGVWVLWWVLRWAQSPDAWDLIPGLCCGYCLWQSGDTFDSDTWGRAATSSCRPGLLKSLHALATPSWLPEGSEGRLLGTHAQGSALCWLPHPRVPTWSTEAQARSWELPQLP